MSTVRYNITQERFARLARLGERVFHAQDLTNLWEITSKNTLHTTLKRYVQQGLLFRVFRGLYAIEPVELVSPTLLGIKALHQYAYVSTESVLIEHGVLNQTEQEITLVSAVSKHFSIRQNHFRSRKLSDQYLFNSAGIIVRDSIRFATLERAVADLLYFNPHVHFDNPGIIKWPKIKSLQKNIGYPLTPKRYDHS